MALNSTFWLVLITITCIPATPSFIRISVWPLVQASHTLVAMELPATSYWQDKQEFDTFLPNTSH